MGRMFTQRHLQRFALALVLCALVPLAGRPVTATPAGIFNDATTTAVQGPSAPRLAATIASVVDREISDVEQLTVAAAEAMPEDKFNFSPESLSIRGSDYKGVRTFAEQIKHVAASNYAIWARLTGDKIPDDYRGGTGPAAFKTKVEIMKFLKDSFELGHRAAATLTAQTMFQNLEGSNSSRFHQAMFGVTHAYDSYG